MAGSMFMLSWEDQSPLLGLKMESRKFVKFCTKLKLSMSMSN